MTLVPYTLANARSFGVTENSQPLPREQPHFLKIGVTTRSVEQRVKEINSATGIVIPFGVRAVWPVRNPEQTEKEIHEMLSPYRVRADREFFQIEYQQACKKILDLIKAKDLESQS